MELKSKDWLLDPEIMIKAHRMGLRILELNVFARMRGSGISHVRMGTVWVFIWFLLKFRFSREWRKEIRDLPEYSKTSTHFYNRLFVNHYTHRRTCRVCAETDLSCLIDFGQMPLANSFLTSETEFSSESFLPAWFILLQDCGLVQLLDVISPTVLFQTIFM